MHRSCASSLVSVASGAVIWRKWRRIVLETAAVLVFRAGQVLIISARKNCGDLHFIILHERDHNPADATRCPGTSRNIRPFSSARGTAICSSLPPSHLIAVIRTRLPYTL